MNTDTHSNSN